MVIGDIVYLGQAAEPILLAVCSAVNMLTRLHCRPLVLLSLDYQMTT